MGIEEYKNNYPQMLSGGVRQRVNIARAFIYPSKVIIMDEPFKSIDIKNKMIIMDSLKEILKRESRTVLLSIHYSQIFALLVLESYLTQKYNPLNIYEI